jgi:D-xylose transport system substrate-binding protein
MFARTTFDGLQPDASLPGPTTERRDCMRRSSVSVAALGVAAAFALAACSSSGSGGGTSSQPPAPVTTAPVSSTPVAPSSAPASSSSGAIDGKGTKVGIILPDTTSSPRWVTADPTALKADCTKYNLQCDIQNANGDPQKMKTIAQQMESSGVKALMIVDLNQPSGAAIEQAAQKAGVIPIDYDRLTPGGGAALYVSFDNVKVGEVQGQTLAQCPQVKGQSKVQYVDIDGAPTDNNATLFAQGYDSVLSKQAGWTRVAKQTGNWDGPTAGRVFNSMLGKNPNIKAVMVANDTMAAAVITDLTRQGLNGKVAVSGQDATAGGLQQIMDGNQCFSIYKPSAAEADPAIKAIAQLVTGGTPQTNGTVTDPMTHKKVPAILATPIAVTKANVAQPINDKYTPKNTVCTNAHYKALCKQDGVK